MNPDKIICASFPHSAGHQSDGSYDGYFQFTQEQNISIARSELVELTACIDGRRAKKRRTLICTVTAQGVQISDFLIL